MGKWKQAHHRWLDPDYFGDDDENFITLPTGERVLRDGGRMKISMMAMDSADAVLKATAADMQRQRDSKQRGFSLADARRFGLNDGADLHRPGFRYNLSDEMYDAREAYRDYENSQAEAWRAPPVGAGEHDFGAAPKAGAIPMSNNARPGMSCTVKSGGRGEGSRGVLREVDGSPGWLECVPIPSGNEDKLENNRADAATMQRDHAQRMSEIYAAHDRALEAAWKGHHHTT
jgi:hypothetical protein